MDECETLQGYLYLALLQEYHQIFAHVARLKDIKMNADCFLFCDVFITNRTHECTALSTGFASKGDSPFSVSTAFHCKFLIDRLQVQKSVMGAQDTLSQMLWSSSAAAQKKKSTLHLALWNIACCTSAVSITYDSPNINTRERCRISPSDTNRISPCDTLNLPGGRR